MSRVAPGTRTTVLLFGAAVVAWAVTAERMRGMDAGPGTDLGGLGWFLGVWAAMMAAMMLPSAAPAALRVARLARRAPTLLFVAGYLAVWTGYGLAAYAIYRLVTSFDIGRLAWDEGGPYVAGAAIVAAGIYELSPVKARYLRRCRRSSVEENALRAGLRHGLDCVACCFALMAVLFALGVMSVLWTAVVAGVIFAEKVLPQGVRVSRGVAAALMIVGVLVAVSPSAVPGLTEPDRAPSMEMDG